MPTPEAEGAADVVRRERRPAAWMAWAAVVPLVAAAAGRGLWAPDEPRRAQVARELFESGDLLVLKLCGRPYPDKPPLFYWLSGLVGAVSGWSELAMRLVPLAATVLTAWLAARWARRSFGPLEARLAPLAFLTTAMVAVEGHQLQIDPLLACCTTAALLVASGIGRVDPAMLRGASVRSGSRAWLAVGALTGLGGLAKGPVAFVEVGLPVLAWFALDRRLPPAGEPAAVAARPRAHWAVGPAAVLLAVGPVLAWALAVSIREPAFAEELLWGQHAGRVLDARRHAGPVWKSAVRLPLLLLPWTAPVAAGLLRAWRARRDPGERELVRVALWFGVLVVFFSLVPNKRDLYLLPAYPAAALLAARGLAQDVRAGRWTAGLTWSVASGLAAVVVAGLAAGPLAAREGLELPGIAWRGLAVALTALAGLVLVLRARRRRRALELVGAGALGWSAVLLVVALLVLPVVDPLKSSEELGRWLAARPERPRAIPCWGVHPEGYRFYGGVPAVELEGELATARAREGDDFLALVRRERWEQLPPAERARLRILRETRVGGREVVVVGADQRGPRDRQGP